MIIVLMGLFCFPFGGRTASEVVAWGTNVFGQTDVPADLTNVVAIAAGYAHSLALKADGTPANWGAFVSGGENVTSITTWVPTGLTDLAAVAAGSGHDVALRRDGRVVAWGYGYDANGRTNLPPSDLTNIAAITIGYGQNLALRSDASLAAWSYPSSGSTDPQPALSGSVVAIASGQSHSLALKVDGTVAAWGDNRNGQATVPLGLTNAVAIAAGDRHSLALKADGTVVAWGDNSRSQRSVPAGLTNVVAISANGYHSLALRKDCSVVAWGNNTFGECTLPAGLFANVAAISAGFSHNLALVGDVPPRLNRLGISLTVPFGTFVSLPASGTGSRPLRYQWRFNGREVPELTNAVLRLEAAQFNQAGAYSVTVSNDFGDMTSEDITLSVSPLLIRIQPKDRSTYRGGTASFTVGADGIDLSYQWQFNGTNLPGATSSSLTLTNVDVDQAGLYRVIVSNTVGAVKSSDANLSVGRVIPWGGEINVPAGLTDVVAVAGGPYHSLALRSDGTVVAWGGNPYGQTDVPAGMSNVVAVAAAENHSLALKSDGRVVHWTYTCGGTAVPPSVPPDLTNAVAISARWRQNLALRSDGTVVGWDNNFCYQRFRSTPDLTNVIALATAQNRGLLLKADGSVFDWRYYRGDGVTAQHDDSISVVSNPSNIVAVAIGNAHNLALKADGTVVAWGDNSYGQTNVPQDLTNVLEIAAGAYHSLALTANGTVVAWGYNGAGQTNVPTIATNIVAIAAGDTHSLAVQGYGPPVLASQLIDRVGVYGSTAWLRAASTGGLPLNYQWRFAGADLPNATNTVLELSHLQFNQSGLYSVVVSNSFGAVTNSALLTVVPLLVTIQPRDQATYKGGTVAFKIRVSGLTPSYQWQFNGTNLVGETNSTLTLANVQLNQSGNYAVVISNEVGTTRSVDATLSVGRVVAWGDNYFYQTETPSSLLSDAVAIAAGNTHIMALKGDGTVISWGDNTFGEIDVPPGLKGVAGVSAGDGFSLALTSDGDVVGWGNGFFGQTQAPLDLRNAVEIAAGQLHGMALKADGSLAGWGQVVYGRPFVLPNLSNVTSLAAGLSHDLALDADGTVVAWGDNSFGQTNVPTGLTDVIAVAAGAAHSLALRADGIVVAWGDNFYGQSRLPKNLNNVVAIAAGWYHSLALKADGTIVAWGNNASGQLNTPAGLHNVISIAGGAGYSVALVGDGPPVHEVSLTDPTWTATSFNLSLPTDSSRIYRLEYADSLGDNTWVALSLVAGNGRIEVVTDTNATSSHRFYRVRRW